jgi:hypothetical protein
MVISQKILMTLPVVTKSDQTIGRIIGFELDSDSQSILNYKVKPNVLSRGLLDGDLIINRGQVVDITEEKFIIDDNFVADKSKEIAIAKKSAKKESPAIAVKEGD